MRAHDVILCSVSSIQDLNCLFEIYLKPLQKETFLTQDEVKQTPYWSRGSVLDWVVTDCTVIAVMHLGSFATSLHVPTNMTDDKDLHIQLTSFQTAAWWTGYDPDMTQDIPEERSVNMCWRVGCIKAPLMDTRACPCTN